MRRPPRLDGADVYVGLYVEIRHHLCRQWLGATVDAIRDDDGLVVAFVENGNLVRSGPYYTDRGRHEVRLPILEILATLPET